jgi:hypothetical protein
LRDRDQNAGVGRSADGVKKGVDARRGTGGQIDVLGISRETISACIATRATISKEIVEDGIGSRR